MKGRLGRVAVVSALAGALLACSKKDDPKPAATTSLRMLPGQGPPAAPEDPIATATRNSGLAPGHDPVEYDGALLGYTVTVTLEAAAPRVDPDLAIVQTARATASECFTGVAEGPDVRSAVIRVTVVSSGRVSRTDVVSDPDVADCLTRVGNGLHFSSQDDRPGAGGTDNGGAGIRSFSIDVTVTRNH
jgi:hypothetical protein